MGNRQSRVKKKRETSKDKQTGYCTETCDHTVEMASSIQLNSPYLHVHKLGVKHLPKRNSSVTMAEIDCSGDNVPERNCPPSNSLQPVEVLDLSSSPSKFPVTSGSEPTSPSGSEPASPPSGSEPASPSSGTKPASPPVTATPEEIAMPKGVYYLQEPSTFEVTSEGAVFPSASDTQQAGSGVTITVPKGAVPEGVSTSLEVATCLNIGPVEYPEGVVPVSPILKLHPKEQFDLEECITVTLPHALSKGADIREVGVMKAADEHHQFQLQDCAETNVKLEERDGLGVATFSLKHFCYVQLYNKVTKESVNKALYCICPVLPETSDIPINGEPLTFYFCVTYRIEACLNAIEEQCRDISKLKKHKHRLDHDKIKKITFKPNSQISIQASCSRPTTGSGWEWNDIFTQDGRGIETQSVQPWSNDLLEYEAKNFVYPPSFKLDVYSCAGNQTSSDKVTITFSSSEETTPGAFLHKIVVVLPGYKAQRWRSGHELVTKKLLEVAQLLQFNFLYIVTKLFQEDLIPQSKLDSATALNPPNSERERAIDIVKFLINRFDVHPAAFDVFMNILRNTPGIHKSNLDAIFGEEHETDGSTIAAVASPIMKPDSSETEEPTTEASGLTCLRETQEGDIDTNTDLPPQNEEVNENSEEDDFVWVDQETKSSKCNLQ